MFIFQPEDSFMVVAIHHLHYIDGFSVTVVLCNNMSIRGHIAIDADRTTELANIM